MKHNIKLLLHSIQETLEDAEDLLAIRKVKEEEKDIPPLSMADVKKIL